MGWEKLEWRTKRGISTLDKLHGNHFTDIGKGRTVMYRGRVPNYPGDLNAMRQVELHLLKDKSLWRTYHMWLCKLQLMTPVTSIKENFHAVVTASAEQKSQAFLRTVGKWDEL